MELSEIREIIQNDHASFDPEVCVRCEGESALIDSVGLRWCCDHQFRGQFVNLMDVQGYPHLRFERGDGGFYAIGPGASLIINAVLSGTDDYIARAFSALETLNERNIA